MVINRFDLEDIKPKIEDEFDIYQIEEETLKKFETSEYIDHIVILSEFCLSLVIGYIAFSSYHDTRCFFCISYKPNVHASFCRGMLIENLWEP